MNFRKWIGLRTFQHPLYMKFLYKIHVSQNNSNFGKLSMIKYKNDLTLKSEIFFPLLLLLKQRLHLQHLSMLSPIVPSIIGVLISTIFFDASILHKCIPEHHGFLASDLSSCKQLFFSKLYVQIWHKIMVPTFKTFNLFNA